MAAGALWEEVVSNLASLLQIMGVLQLLLRAADKLLCLRFCKLECARLKQRISDIHHLFLPAAATAAAAANNQQDAQHVEVAMDALGLVGAVNLQPTIDAANHLVDSYSSSSMFHILCNSRRIKVDMSEMRCRVTAYHDLLFCIHAGVAVMSMSSAAAQAQTQAQRAHDDVDVVDHDHD